MKIKAFTSRGGVRHVVFKDPSASGIVCLPLEAGPSMFAKPGNTWQWNGDTEKPTITPSVRCSRDHFNITDGMVHFYGDAPHAEAGTTKPLADLGDLAAHLGDPTNG